LPVTNRFGRHTPVNLPTHKPVEMCIMSF